MKGENVKKIIKRVFEYELYPQIEMPTKELLEDIQDFAYIYDEGGEIPDYIKNSAIVLIMRHLQTKKGEHEK